MGINRELWTEYRNTWELFSRKLNQLQELTAAGEAARPCAKDEADFVTNAAKADAMREVEEARQRHGVARDRLAKRLSAASPLAGAPSPSAKSASRRPDKFFLSASA